MTPIRHTPIGCAVLLVCLLLGAACSNSTKPRDVGPPKTPANFRLLGASDGQVFLRWDAGSEPDLRGYRLYRREGSNGAFQPLLDLRATEFVDAFLSYDTSYFYRITAVDFAGNESPPTESVQATPRNLSPPQRPTGVEAFGRDLALEGRLEIEVRWAPNEESDLDHYLIYRGGQDDFPATPEALLDSSAISLYHDRGVSVGERRAYRVVAVDRGGLISEASEASSDLILAQAGLLTPTGGVRVAASFDLTWQEVPGAVAYRVFVDAAPVTDPLWHSPLLTGGVTRLAYGGPRLTPGKTYYWWVAAYSRSSGTGAPPAEPEINSQSQAARFSTQ